MVRTGSLPHPFPQNKLFDATRGLCVGLGLEVAIDPAEASAEDSAEVELWGVSVRTRLSEARGLGHWEGLDSNGFPTCLGSCKAVV